MNKCCICGNLFEGLGNNPDGAKWIENGKVIHPWFNPEEVCCNECNNRYVILGRMYTIYNGRVELFEKGEILGWNIQRSLNKEEIKDILTTAIEGGIGYWACLGNDDEEWVKARTEYKEAHNETPCYCDTAYDIMFKNHKAVIFYDIQDDDKPLYLTKDKLKEGCRLFEKARGKSIHQMFDDAEFDAEDADCIIQYALFGEVIYS